MSPKALFQGSPSTVQATAVASGAPMSNKSIKGKPLRVSPYLRR
jgi:hypothetical protein